jgi:hypothetical protein
MLRIAGLPALARFPHAAVTRERGQIDVVFGGGDGGEQRISVDAETLAGIEDAEQTELELLARLQAAGYEVERRTGGPGDERPTP